MPIYEYQCRSCAHRFEVKQGIKDEPIASCIRCGQAVTKLISSPAIMFKGTGWYVTDYSEKLKPAGVEGAEKPAEKQGDRKPTQPAPAAATAPSGAQTTSNGSPAPAGSTSSAASTNTSSTPASSSSSQS